MVQWLGLRAFKAKSLGSVLGQGTKIQKLHGTNDKSQTNTNTWKMFTGTFSSVVKTPSSHCRGTVSIPRWRTKIPYAVWCSQKKKELDTLVGWLCCWCGSAQKYKNNHDDHVLSFC